MPDRFDDLDLSGDDTIGTPAGEKKVISDISLNEIARWLWNHKLSGIRIAPKLTKDGKLDLNVTTTQFPSYWKPQQ